MSPLTGGRSIVVNEMTSPAWTYPDPTSPGATTGQSALVSFTFETDPLWIWAGVGYLLGFWVMSASLGALALKVSQVDTSGASVNVKRHA